MIRYFATGLPICDFIRDSSGYCYQLSLEKKGVCTVEANIQLTRSEYSNPDFFIKRFVLVSKAEEEAKAKAAAELKAKQEAEANAAAELKAKQEADAKAASIAAANKKTTITCVKGKLNKKVTAVKPRCPNGYKVKK